MMKTIRTFIETHRKILVLVVGITALLALLGAAALFFAESAADSPAIGEENARQLAFADAGISSLAAESIDMKHDIEQGEPVYQISFTTGDTRYTCRIKASDGTILQKERETASSQPTSTVPVQLSPDAAREKALADAGLTSADVTFTKTELDWEKGILVYDVEFIAGNTEYDYEVSADTGSIYGKSIKTYTPGGTNPTAQPTTSQISPNTSPTTQPTTGPIDPDTARQTALSDAKLTSSDVTFIKTELEYEDGIPVYEIDFYTPFHTYQYEIHAETGKILSREVEAHQTGNGNGGASPDKNSWIGVEQAKAIAANHAGLPLFDIVFYKTKLEEEDGYWIYEIEFRKNHREYEYEIDAVTGEILKYDSEWDD